MYYCRIASGLVFFAMTHLFLSNHYNYATETAWRKSLSFLIRYFLFSFALFSATSRAGGSDKSLGLCFFNLVFRYLFLNSIRYCFLDRRNAKLFENLPEYTFYCLFKKQIKHSGENQG